MHFDPFHTLVSAAILAPSGDNTQPWCFEIDEQESSISACVDDTRDTSPMNAGQRMARVACGAALENIIRTAEFNGWNPTIAGWLANGRGIKVRIASQGNDCGTIEDCISLRQTNRMRYDRRPIAAETLQYLAGCMSDGSESSMIWITDRKAIEALAASIGESDSLMFGDPEFLHAFLENVRWDLKSKESAAHGLPRSTLGLSVMEQTALPAVARLPDWMIRGRLCRSSFARKASKMIRCSSGVWILATGESSTQNDFVVGRLMQRAWLRITAAGLAAQPMMSLPVLLSCQALQTLPRPTSQAVTAIHGRICELVGVRTGWSVAAVLRFGYSAAAPARTGRRHPEEVTRWLANVLPALTV